MLPEFVEKFFIFHRLKLNQVFVGFSSFPFGRRIHCK